MAWSGWEKLRVFGAKCLRLIRPSPADVRNAAKITPVRDTFCILPWSHLQIAPNGTVKMCCIAGEDLHDRGRPLSLYTDTYEDIWNSDYMRDVRRGMAQGEKISACRRCFEEEDSVGESRRTIQNATWLAKSDRSRQELIELARSNQWRVSQRPTFLQLNMGSLCNLACRMCSSQYSSRIESDPVHSKWMPAGYPDVARWRGARLQIGPRPFFGVTYTGFYDYEAWTNPPVRWSSGSGAIKLAIPEGVTLQALGLSLRTARRPLPGKIRVNGLDVFEGTFTVEWSQRFDLPGLDNYSKLEIEIESAAKKGGGRMLGIRLLDVWLERAVTGCEQHTNERTLVRYAANEGWWAQPDIMFGEILAEPDQLRYIIFQGGEPFLVKEFESILDVLISNGSARQVTLEIVSNLTTVKESTLAKLAFLKQIHLGASIDGIGPILEYIRYPAVWKDIEHNLDRFSALPNVMIGFNTAVQAYNLGDVVNILSYCDRRGIDVYMHFLDGPFHLNVAVLPQKIRRAAIDSVRDYLARDDLRPANRSAAEYVVKFLQKHLATQYRDQFVSFVKFTNDMDISRGQSFRALYPELIESFARDGLKWTDESRFAHRAPAA